MSVARLKPNARVQRVNDGCLLWGASKNVIEIPELGILPLDA